jgi:hypothetical protein
MPSLAPAPAPRGPEDKDEEEEEEEDAGPAFPPAPVPRAVAGDAISERGMDRVAALGPFLCG